MGKKNETQLNTTGGSVAGVGSRQEFYRPRQVAEMLGISLRTYYTMVSRGKLHPVKLGTRDGRRTEGDSQHDRGGTW